jgi:hypothetical protein
MRKLPVVLTVTAVIALLGLTAWLNDSFNLHGAGRAVYTAECAGGAWQGTICTGHLVAGDQHRFVALKNHGEVLYWRVGARQVSGKLTDCTIADAKDWSCRQATAQPPAVTMAMKNGRAVGMPGQVPPHHCVAKWKWLLLERGVTWLHDAET